MTLHVETQASPLISAHRLYRLVERALITVLALGRERRRLRRGDGEAEGESEREKEREGEGDVRLEDAGLLGCRVVLIPFD